MKNIIALTNRALTNYLAAFKDYQTYSLLETVLVRVRLKMSPLTFTSPMFLNSRDGHGIYNDLCLEMVALHGVPTDEVKKRISYMTSTLAITLSFNGYTTTDLVAKLVPVLSECYMQEKIQVGYMENDPLPSKLKKDLELLLTKEPWLMMLILINLTTTEGLPV